MKDDRSLRPVATLAKDLAFHVDCQAGKSGLLRVQTDSVSFTVGQRIVLEDKEQFWDSVRVRCQKEDDGSLTVQVLIWAPDLNGALQIAHFRSAPGDHSKGRKPLERDLNHKMLG
jgi:hypothetical protein